MKGKGLYGIIGVLGAAVAIIPLTVYYGIDMARVGGTMPLDCQTACGVATAIGVIILAVVVLSLSFRDTKASAAHSAVLLAGGIGVFAVPQALPFCRAAGMACLYLTKPVLTSLGLAIIILSLALLVLHIIRKRSVAA